MIKQMGLLQAIWLYVKFVLLSAIGALLYLGAIFISQTIVRSSSHARHDLFGYDYVSGLFYGTVIGSALAALYYGGLIIWTAAWVFDKAVFRAHQLNNALDEWKASQA